MGIYLNEGNSLFERDSKKRIYIDKSMMIDKLNTIMDEEDPFVCVSRPRRFGKSMMANMLVAYYDKSVDSRDLFKDLKISKTESFEKHLNKYNVIHLDVQKFLSLAENAKELVAIIQNRKL